ncbi:hypothetical protein AC529_02940 [Thermobifida cellulosilytica TB100]|uniref:Uncharacterized protein n=1 Tax=Thermobifida cellulosilytica TB100 TaxID=665004 RepID=A0A147KLH3_THECS|nr:hypothetical protein AC529_02940 [Thermobifida cellulosilytica TB100]
MPGVSDHERQPDLVERIAEGLRDHPRVILDAFTERDRQRAVAAGRVAGKHLKRATRATVLPEGVLVEFDDIDDPYLSYQEEQQRMAQPTPGPAVQEARDARGGPEAPGVQAAPDGKLPRRIPGAGPRPGPHVPRGR